MTPAAGEEETGGNAKDTAPLQEVPVNKLSKDKGSKEKEKKKKEKERQAKAKAKIKANAKAVRGRGKGKAKAKAAKGKAKATAGPKKAPKKKPPSSEDDSEDESGEEEAPEHDEAMDSAKEPTTPKDKDSLANLGMVGAPAKKKNDDTSPANEFQHIIDALPKECQPVDPIPPTAQSYTLNIQNSSLTVSVNMKRQYFYVGKFGDEYEDPHNHYQTF